MFLSNRQAFQTNDYCAKNLFQARTPSDRRCESSDIAVNFPFMEDCTSTHQSERFLGSIGPNLNSSVDLYAFV